MVDENQNKPDTVRRSCGLEDYPVEIVGRRIAARVPRRFWRSRVITADLADFVAIGHRRIARPRWFQRTADQYFQAVLVHRDKRSQNLVLGEILVSLGENPMESSALRQMLETYGEQLALPIVESDRPPRSQRPEKGGSSEQVFAMRLPDEFDMCVRDLVTHERLSVDRNVPRPPDGFVMTQTGASLRFAFGYSALLETLRPLSFIMPAVLVGMARRPHYAAKLQWMAIASAATAAIFFLMIYPIKYFLNGHELMLFTDRLDFRPAPGSLFSVRVQMFSQFKLTEIEGIRRQGRDVLVMSDRETVRMSCRTKAMAIWLEQALLAVAAYGLSVLDGMVPPQIGGKDAGAVNAPASQKA